MSSKFHKQPLFLNFILQLSTLTSIVYLVNGTNRKDFMLFHIPAESVTSEDPTTALLNPVNSSLKAPLPALLVISITSIPTEIENSFGVKSLTNYLSSANVGHNLSEYIVLSYESQLNHVIIITVKKSEKSNILLTSSIQSPILTPLANTSNSGTWFSKTVSLSNNVALQFICASLDGRLYALKDRWDTLNEIHRIAIHPQNPHKVYIFGDLNFYGESLSRTFLQADNEFPQEAILRKYNNLNSGNPHINPSSELHPFEEFYPYANTTATDHLGYYQDFVENDQLRLLQYFGLALEDFEEYQINFEPTACYLSPNEENYNIYNYPGRIIFRCSSTEVSKLIKYVDYSSIKLPGISNRRGILLHEYLDLFDFLNGNIILMGINKNIKLQIKFSIFEHFLAKKFFKKLFPGSTVTLSFFCREELVKEIRNVKFKISDEDSKYKEAAESFEIDYDFFKKCFNTGNSMLEFKVDYCVKGSSVLMRKFEGVEQVKLYMGGLLKEEKFKEEARLHLKGYSRVAGKISATKVS